MKSFDECPIGTRVRWRPSNKPGQQYTGVVAAHNRSGADIYDIPGYSEHKAGAPCSKVEFDRVPVRADHDGKWHAQDLHGLSLME
jgi:hypothetical protein